MQPLEKNRRKLIWLGIYPADKATRLEKFLYAIHAVAVFSLTFAVFSASLMFFIKFLSIDLETVLFGIWQINVFITVLSMFVIMFFLRQKLKMAFGTLSYIYSASKQKFII